MCGSIKKSTLDYNYLPLCHLKIKYYQTTNCSFLTLVLSNHVLQFDSKECFLINDSNLSIKNTSKLLLELANKQLFFIYTLHNAKSDIRKNAQKEKNPLFV